MQRWISAQELFDRVEAAQVAGHAFQPPVRRVVPFPPEPPERPPYGFLDRLSVQEPTGALSLPTREDNA